MKLTKEELQIAIQCIANTSVPVTQAGKLIDLVNKMSVMMDEVKEPEASPTTEELAKEKKS
jgi:hypothetical protein